MIADRHMVVSSKNFAAQHIEPEPDRLLSLDEVAEMMSVGNVRACADSVRRWIRDGVKVRGTNRIAKLMPTQLPKCNVVRLSDLWQFIEELQPDWKPVPEKTDEEYLAMIGLNRTDPSAGRGSVPDGARTPAAG